MRGLNVTFVIYSNLHIIKSKEADLSKPYEFATFLFPVKNNENVVTTAYKPGPNLDKRTSGSRTLCPF